MRRKIDFRTLPLLNCIGATAFTPSHTVRESRIVVLLAAGAAAPAMHDAAQTFQESQDDSKSTVSMSVENVVAQADKPVKEKVREWLQREIVARRPPPDLHEIRRTLGWDTSPTPPADRPSRRKP